MIGRTAIKNPAIFKQCLDYQKHGKYEEVNKIEMLRRYAALCKKYNYGETNNNLKMIAESFTKGEDNSAQFRNQLSRLKTSEQILNAFDTFISNRK